MRAYLTIIYCLNFVFISSLVSSSSFAMTNVTHQPVKKYSTESLPNDDQWINKIQYENKKENHSAGIYSVVNPQQGYHAEFNSQNINLQLNDSQQIFSMSLKGIGHGEQITLPAVNLITQSNNEENRINYHRQHGITEWYINRLDGLEQGFTIEQPLESRMAGPLQVQLSFNQQWQAKISPDGLELYQGNDHLSYKKLKVWDSLGEIHSSKMMLVDSHTVNLIIDERNAVYPLYIDPVIQVNKTVGAFNHLTFGWSVSVDENTFAVGDPNGWLGSTDGILYGFYMVFDINGFEEVDVGYDTFEDAHFGHAVAVEGDILVVGAPFNDADLYIDAGAAYIYSRDQGGADNWGFVRELSPSPDNSLQAGDLFGASVAISNDTIVIGAPGRSVDMNESAGAVYVFKKDAGGIDNWGEVDKLFASTDFQSGDLLGQSVDIDGNLIIVGAQRNDDLGSLAGSAYIFEYQREYYSPIFFTWKWLERKKLLPTGGTGGEFFGKSVAIDNDTVIVGAYGDDPGGVINSGSTFIFQQDQGGDDNWGQVQKITATDGATNDAFGGSVAISNDTIVVGAVRDEDNGSYSGSAYVFQRNIGGADNWGQLEKILPDDGSEDDQFGFSVGISGSNIIIGAPYNEDTGSTHLTGSAYIFEIQKTQMKSLPAVQMLLLN